MKELERIELSNISGGYIKMPPWVKTGFWFGVFCAIVENWSDLKSGVADGWSDAMKSN